MLYRAYPFVAAFAVVAVGCKALTYSQPAPEPSFGYRVTGAYPVVVRTEPVWGAFVAGTLAPGSFVAALDDGGAYADGGGMSFRRVRRPGGDGWVLAADLTPEMAQAEQASGFEPTSSRECISRPADCVGP